MKAAILAETARRSGSRSFSSFVKQAWQYVPNCDPLQWNWHIDGICSHAVEVAVGRIEKLAINIGPGHGKSALLAVLLPAWVWTWWPACQFICASYSSALAIRDSVRSRAVIETDWYRETFMKPGGWHLRHDQNAKGYYVNTAGGERFAVGVGGAGRRAHVIIVDDPIDQVDVYSEAVRSSTEDWINQTVSQRFVDPKAPKFIMIGARLHPEDAFSNLGADWERLVLPTEFDHAQRARTFHYVKQPDGTRARELHWEDPRTKPGELLFPERFSREVCEKMKQSGTGNLGPDGFMCQQNQDPRNFAGGMFSRADWRFFERNLPAGVQRGEWAQLRPKGCTNEPAMPLPLQIQRQIITVDAAFKDNPSGSRVAIHVWAVHGADRFLLYRRTEHMDFVLTKQALRETVMLYPGAVEKYIEDAANGAAIIAELRHEITGLIPVSVSKYGPKTARAAAAQPYVRAHNCYLPEGAEWVGDFVRVFAGFPANATKDADDVDAFSMAMRALEEQPEAEVGRVNWGRR